LLETGTMTWWVVAVLRDAGLEPVVIDARQFKLISHSKKKNDKHDARALADALRGGIGPALFGPCSQRPGPPGTGFAADPHQVVKQSVASWNAARGLLRSAGVMINKSQWKNPEGWEQTLDNPAIPVWMKPLLITHREIWEHLESERACLDSMVKAELGKWPEAEILLEMPGFGPVVSLAVLCHLDDPHRFKRPGQVASYAGLAPTSRDSAETIRHGGITRQGNAILRHLMVQAAGPLCAAKS
jgi:transposase